MDAKPRVLFLCTGNSCRSQMAEGWARALHGPRLDAASAGTQPGGVHPLAVRAMAEAGVDLSGHQSEHVDRLRGEPFDLVITLCDSARDSCPAWVGAGRVLHMGFDDPPRLAAGAANDNEALPHFRRVRDEIRDFVAALPEQLASLLQRHSNPQGATR